MQIIGFRSATRANARGAVLRVPTTLGVALLIWAAAPGPTVVIWLAVSMAMTLGDILFLRVLNRRGPETLRPLALLYLGYTFVYVLVYNSISMHLWKSSNPFGKAGAVLLLTGAMLHMSHFLFHSRALLAAALTPFMIFLLVVPVVDFAVSGDVAALAVSVAGLFCLLHLRAILLDTIGANDSVHAALREARIQRASAEQANSAKSGFLAMISHEIRTPMNAVVAATELLGGSKLDAEQRRHASMLKNATELLMGLLNDVLDFSKIEAGKMEVDETDFDLRERLAAVSGVWAPRAESKTVRLLEDIDPALPQRITSDPLRLQQIVFNLLSNAVKFTDEGEIRLSARALEGDWLEIEVADTGCGVSEAHLERIFNSFEQADLGVARRAGGTGLGLAISRQLARLLGGDLTARSAVGRGSTFRLTLPLRAAARQSAPETRPASGDVKGVRVLAADDNEVNRIVLGAILDRLGCRTEMVEDGAQAVARAERERFDIILLDMQMPVMSGLEAARAVRVGSGVNRGTPIIALTANALDGHREEWMAAGANDFLTKPVDSARLRESIHRATQLEMSA